MSYRRQQRISKPVKKSCRVSRTQHAKRRALQRYGIEVSNQDLRRMVAIIQRGDGEIIERRSSTKTAYKIYCDWFDKHLKVGYSSSTKQITTFLPSINRE